MSGWLDPKTQRSTAFYAVLGVLCSRACHVGLDKWTAALLACMALGGTFSGLLALVGRTPPPEPPGNAGS